ncbi:MAG: ATP-binding protein [Imperialibacter sp.]|uniref:ATP-binding protein n=1 Tax=Imperialibacter sp. TaxID=2038411 RepID=UPI0032EE960A
MYPRIIETRIENKLGKGKAIVVTGPRQVGKTTLIKDLLRNRKYLFLDGDDPAVRNILTNPNTEDLRSLIGQHDTLFIDEAQRIDNIGLTMKLITDQFKNVQLIASGSSAFDISSKLNEPLTGRKWDFTLLPICWEEYENHIGFLKSEQQLHNRLIYGFYPEVLNHPGEEKDILRELTNSYLYRDVLSLADIRKPEVLEKLVQALALQVGSEVSYNELAQTVGVDKNTVASYIDILCDGFVIFKLNSYSKNIRNEIKSNRKIYFYDNGIRNMVVGNFNNLGLREDTGYLWENFLIAERLKQNLYKNTFSNIYFWRSRQQQEIDLVEENNGQITGFEFKWNMNKRVKLPKTFMETYKAEGKVINPSNFREFVKI